MRCFEWFHTYTEGAFKSYESGSRMKKSVLTDISVLGFYGYIGDISVDIFT